MNDYYLQSSTETTMTDALIEAGIVSVIVHPNGATERYALAGCTVDHVGPVAWLVYDGTEVTVKSDSRWHTNLRTEVPLTVEQLAVLPVMDPPPTNPVRRFFDHVEESAPSTDAGNDNGP